MINENKTTNENLTPSRPAEEVHTVRMSELSQGIVGLFDAPHAANQAFEVLLNLGHQPKEIGILIAERTKGRFFDPSPLTHAAEVPEATPEEVAVAESAEKTEEKAVMLGAGAASAVGALGGFLVAATAAVLIPGMGLLLIGPLAGLGAGFGAFVGGVYAVPAIEYELTKQLEQYESEVRAGKVLIHVTPRDAEDERRIRSEWARIQGLTV